MSETYRAAEDYNSDRETRVFFLKKSFYDEETQIAYSSHRKGVEGRRHSVSCAGRLESDKYCRLDVGGYGSDACLGERKTKPYKPLTRCQCILPVRTW